MKPLLRKIPALIAMVIGLFSFVWYVQYLLGSDYPDIWLLSVIMAMFSMPFFFIDAIISFVRARKKEDPGFNYILALVLVGAIPMVVVFGGDGKDYFNVIWNVYYLLVYALEILSIKKAWALMKANRKKAE